MNLPILAGEPLIFDADVLIDFINADRSVLSLMVKYLAPVYVVRPVLRQVKAIGSEEELTGLGVTVIAPAIEDLYAAANIRSPADFEDQLCLLTAKRHGFTCVSNDAGFRNRCMDDGVPCLRGLRLLLELHSAGGISGEGAARLAERIHKNNPNYITESILADFMNALKQAGEGNGDCPDTLRR